MQVRNTLRNLNLLNLLLLSAAALFVIYSIFPSFPVEVRYSVPVSKNGAEEEEPRNAQPRIFSIAEYANISEDNLFHPERKIPAEKKDEQPLPKPEFVLYGTLVTNDVRVAYMEDMKAPRSTTGRGKRQTALKKGDSLSGFTVSEIGEDKVVMVRGKEKMVIAVHNPSRKTEAVQSTAAPAESGKPQPRTPLTPAQNRDLRRSGAAAQRNVTSSPIKAQPATPSLPAQGQ